MKRRYREYAWQMLCPFVFVVCAVVSNAHHKLNTYAKPFSAEAEKFLLHADMNWILLSLAGAFANAVLQDYRHTKQH
jgi:carbon starvation protein CstA